MPLAARSRVRAGRDLKRVIAGGRGTVAVRNTAWGELLVGTLGPPAANSAPRELDDDALNALFGDQVAAQASGDAAPNGQFRGDSDVPPGVPPGFMGDAELNALFDGGGDNGDVEMADAN